jgi:hypothetical protein
MSDAKPKKIGLPSRAKKQDRTDAGLAILARKWADLHANPKQRDKMDEILAGLSEDEARRVVLCGQRIAAGLEPRIAK